MVILRANTTSVSLLKASLCDQKEPVFGAVLTPLCVSESLQGSFTVRMGCFLRLIPPMLRHRQSGSFPTDDPPRGASKHIFQEEQAQFCVSRRVKKNSVFHNAPRSILQIRAPGLRPHLGWQDLCQTYETVKSFYLLDERRVRQGIRLGAGRPNWLFWPISANEVTDSSHR